MTPASAGGLLAQADPTHMSPPTHIYTSALSRRDRRWWGRSPRAARRHAMLIRVSAVVAGTAVLLELLPG